MIYLLILLIHTVWAVHILRTGKTSLAVGAFRTPGLILLGLFVLNLPSIVVFIPATGFATRSAAIGHALYHILLTVDEILRVRNARVRWVFLVDHLAWSALLFVMAFFVFIS
jgi:hypothetical protein